MFHLEHITRFAAGQRLASMRCMLSLTAWFVRRAKASCPRLNESTTRKLRFQRFGFCTHSSHNSVRSGSTPAQ